VVISLNIMFAFLGVAIAVVPGVLALHMISVDERGRKELPDTTAPSVPLQLGSCPYCREVLEWLVPLPTPGVAAA
jgi:hypothetical protein